MKYNATHRPRVLVLTSTFPRWENDPEPAFVFELSRRLTGAFDGEEFWPIKAPFKICQGLKREMR